MGLEEDILVVKRELLFAGGEWQGLKTDGIEGFYDFILQNLEVMNRGKAEHDGNHKQIIPYVLYKHRDKFFLYEYIKGTTETRLHHNYILGIAGHLNPIEGAEDQIQEGMMREWDEEVHLQGNISSKKLVGIMNDDRREVENVHLGLIYVFEGDSDKIEIKETEKMAGKLMTIEEMEPLIGNVEELGWAPLLYPYLKNF
jgi:predicted NUDIX family phosphoesterase